MSDEFRLTFKMIRPRVMEVDINCQLDLKLLERGFEYVIRNDPRIREVIGRALIHSMTPESRPTFVIYHSNEN